MAASSQPPLPVNPVIIPVMLALNSEYTPLPVIN